MSIQIIQNNHPNYQELEPFFESAFAVCDILNREQSESKNQTLKEWFAIDKMREYLTYGALIEARERDHLVVALFVAQQHPLTWPDGNKMEIFILAVSENMRGEGIGKKLVDAACSFAKDNEAQSVVVNTHRDLVSVQEFYKKLNFQEVGILKNYYANGDAVFFQKKL